VVQMDQNVSCNLVLYTCGVSPELYTKPLSGIEDKPSNCSKYCGSCIDWASQLRTSSTPHSITTPRGTFDGIGDACCNSPMTVLLASVFAASTQTLTSQPRGSSVAVGCLPGWTLGRLRPGMECSDLVFAVFGVGDVFWHATKTMALR
jgi:hypothetical protein